VFVSAIIPAAGKGLRFGGKTNKQFLKINEKPILYYSIRQFEISSLINEIILVVPEDWLSEIPQLLQKFQFKKLSKIISGGNERFNSVLNGLHVVDPKSNMIAIHDGVRPLVSTKLIDSTIIACIQHQAVTAAVPITDTVKVVQGGVIKSTLDRSLLWAIQTPQVFHYDLLMRAFQKKGEISSKITDDAMLIEHLGHTVKVVEGDYRNIKITSPGDLDLVRFYLDTTEPKKC